MTIFGDGKQERAFSYISDVAPIIAESINKPKAYNKTFNIGADTPCSVLNLANLTAQAMEVTPEIQFLQARNEVVHAYADHSLARKHFGELIRNVSIQEGLQKMAQWAKTHGDRRSKYFKNIEVQKNIPEGWILSGAINPHD